MRYLFTLLLCGAVALVCSPSVSRSSEIYKWVDKKGTVHYTDNPEELPEPMRSKALRELEKKEREGKDSGKEDRKRPPRLERRQTGSSYKDRHDRIPYAPVDRAGTSDGRHNRPKKIDTGVKESDSGVKESDSEQKNLWKARIEKARKKVAEIEARCEKLESDRDESRRKSLTFARPADRQDAVRKSEELDKCKKELQEARRDLDVRLPEEARREGIPPGWLD